MASELTPNVSLREAAFLQPPNLATFILGQVMVAARHRRISFYKILAIAWPARKEERSSRCRFRWCTSEWHGGPEKAKYHFEKSGIGNTVVPIVVAEVTPGAVEQALFLQREAKKIGLNIDVQKVATDGYWSSVWKVAPFCATQWNMRPTANIMMTVAFHSQAKWNESYWKNEQFDQLLTDVLAVTDTGKRKQMYCDMQTLIHEEGGSIFPAHTNYIDAAADHVKGRTHVPLNSFGGCESPPFLWRDDA